MNRPGMLTRSPPAVVPPQDRQGPVPGVRRSVSGSGGARAVLSNGSGLRAVAGLACAGLAWACLGAASARAQGFAAAVTPPRFEISVAPGSTQRQVMEITHVGAAPGHYRVYTSDWQLGEDGSLTFFDALQPGSCRPWVAIERRQLELTSGMRMRYRFEITVPADASSGECRFALMLEGAPETVQARQASVPMSGRIAVIVYARIGAARPLMEIVETGMQPREGREVPAVRLRNTGNATGRPGGFVAARDAAGGFVDLVPEAVPVLPGTTRWIALMPNAAPERPASAPAAALRLPLQVEGTLEIGPAPHAKLPLSGTYR
jgi:hypothetical protein